MFSKGFLYRVIKKSDCVVKSYPFPKQQILDFSKLNEFADYNFKFDENGRKLSKRVKNTVEKGEIAHYEQFLLFPQCFSTDFYCKHRKPGLVWERVNDFVANLFHRLARKQSQSNLWSLTIVHVLFSSIIMS